jgi:hypothetical protein
MDPQTNLFLAILSMDAYNRNVDGSFILAKSRRFRGALA